MVFAAIRQGPLGATRLKGIDRKKGLASPGLLHVVTHERWVAAVARNWWASNRALDRFAPVFDTRGPQISTDRIEDAISSALAADGWSNAQQGDHERPIEGSTRLAAHYLRRPAIPHTTII